MSANEVTTPTIPAVLPATRKEPAGYRHHAYAASLTEFGTPRWLPAAEGWILERPIRSTGATDAMGCYPLFACGRWDALADDIKDLRSTLVSLLVVCDPFGAHDAVRSSGCFDVMRPFKEHFVVDLSQAPESFASPHHRRNVKKAERQLEMEWCPDPTLHAAEWIALYEGLIARHQITGIARFSPRALTEQLQVPGLVMARAVHRGATAGIVLWYLDGDVAYYHLGAYNDDGYELGAAFLLFDRAIRHFRHQARWLSLGAGAGADGHGSDGLTRFKRGWATGTRTAWLGGCVLDRKRYDELAMKTGTESAAYFPAYRAGEFS